MKRTPSAPFEPLHIRGESITLNTEGKILVLPTGNTDILPLFNEYVLSPNRLSISESPFGGLKGDDSPDYTPGTLYVNSGDGIDLQDISGTNSTKTLTAGKLKELGLLTINTQAHTITEEFAINNTSTSNNSSIIVDGSSTTGIYVWLGSLTSVVSENGRIKVVGTASTTGEFAIRKSMLVDFDSYKFLTFELESSVSGRLYAGIASTSGNNKIWNDTRFTVSANTNTKWVLPTNAPVGTSGSNPSSTSGSIVLNSITNAYIGITGLANGQDVTIYIDNISADAPKSAYIELQTPDNLADSSLQVQIHDGSTYQMTGTYKLDSSYSAVGTLTPANWKFADGTKLDDCYGSGNGRALFPKSTSGATVNGSSGSITYTQNKGTSRRVGLRVDLPPYNNGEPSVSNIRIKTILSYAPDSSGHYSSTYEFSNDFSVSTGLQNLARPWIALCDPSSNEIDFFLFMHHPKNLIFKRDETGTIHEIQLFPGNGQIYHGRITYYNLSLDSDSNLIPDCLETSMIGSVTKFLQSYDFSTVWYVSSDDCFYLSSDSYTMEAKR